MVNSVLLYFDTSVWFRFKRVEEKGVKKQKPSKFEESLEKTDSTLDERLKKTEHI